MRINYSEKSSVIALVKLGLGLFKYSESPMKYTNDSKNPYSDGKGINQPKISIHKTRNN